MHQTGPKVISPLADLIVCLPDERTPLVGKGVHLSVPQAWVIRVQAPTCLKALKCSLNLLCFTIRNSIL